MRKSAALVVLGLCGGLLACATGGKAIPADGTSKAYVAAPGSTEAAPQAAESPAYVDGDEAPVTANWVGGAAGSEYVLAGAHEEMVGVWVDVPDVQPTAHVPTALALSIDTSGSMQGQKIAHARRAAQGLVDALSDGDYVSLVTFSNRAQVITHATEVTPHSRETLRRAIRGLSADGGTALQEGVAVAMRQFSGVPATHLVKRTVVISDGQATVGSTDPDMIARAAAAHVNAGIQVTSVGVGLDYDESILNALAVQSSGRLYHVAQSEDLEEIIDAEMSLLGSSVAARGIIEIVPAPGVSVRAAANEVNLRMQGDRITVPVGTLYAGQRREILLAVHIPADADDLQPIASVRFHYDDPETAGLRRVRESLVASKITRDPTKVASFAHPRTQELIAMHDASVLAFAASAQANADNLEVAQRQLEDARRSLLQHAKKSKSKASRVRMQKRAEAFGSASTRLRKAANKPKPMRRKEARGTALDLNDDAMNAYGL